MTTFTFKSKILRQKSQKQLAETFTKNRRLLIPHVKIYKYLKTTEGIVRPSFRERAGHLASLLHTDYH